MRLPLGRRDLFSRVFVHGLVVLVVCSVTFIGVATLIVRPELDRRLREFGRWAAPHVCSHFLDDGAAPLPDDAIATIYDTEGNLLGSTVEPPVRPLPRERVGELQKARGFLQPGPRPLQAFWCEGADAYVQFGPPPLPLTGMLLVPVAMVVVMIGLASLPFARSIARPLAKLVGVTQAFGRGDLKIRIDLPRQDEVGELARAFNQMAARLQRLIRAEQELLANVSHELRTPLARMRVVLETAQESPRRASAMLSEIGSDLGDLERLVEDVTETMRLSMSSATLSAEHRLAAKRERTCVTDCVRAAAQRFEALHPDRSLRLDIACADLTAHIDPRLIQRLLDNLLDNARKYSEASSHIVLRAAPDEADRARVVLAVIDDGVGIDEADLPHVFEPFFRGDSGRTQRAPGSGLGLALAKRIVDVHEGELAISSHVGMGTTVRVSLPSTPPAGRAS